MALLAREDGVLCVTSGLEKGAATPPGVYASLETTASLPRASTDFTSTRRLLPTRIAPLPRDRGHGCECSRVAHPALRHLPSRRTVRAARGRADAAADPLALHGHGGRAPARCEPLPSAPERPRRSLPSPVMDPPSGLRRMGRLNRSTFPATPWQVHSRGRNVGDQMPSSEAPQTPSRLAVHFSRTRHAGCRTGSDVTAVAQLLHASRLEGAGRAAASPAASHSARHIC